MEITNEKLKELLVLSEFISEADFKLAEYDAKNNNKKLQDVLVEKNLIKDEQLGWLIAGDLGYKFMNLRNEKIDEVFFNAIPELVARNRGVVAFSASGNKVNLGMVDPTDLEIKNIIEKRLDKEAEVFLITKNDLRQALSQYRSDFKNNIDNIISELKVGRLTKERKDKSIVSLVDNILRYAYNNHASDIHIDPLGDDAIIRFRIDGILHDAERLPKELMNFVVTRIKIMAKIRTDEHRSAQDGKLRFTMEKGEIFSTAKELEDVDVRVSVVPTVRGENVVMRVLAVENQELFLEDLGFSESDNRKITKAAENPVGMILVTGPTGSGKTTTLYSILKILNKREVNIATIEDPVEYSISGVTQIQVNVKTNLTFANGLRAIVRQDPNIIMVGEIRDEETAGIAINAAMTGHLVLSTLHTNDAGTTLPRLADMGIEPFLIASTVKIIIAQRLARRICMNCRESYLLSAEERLAIKDNKVLKELFEKMNGNNLDVIRAYHGKGCKVCSNTGYVGRLGIFEVLEMSEKIRSLILRRVDSDTIMKVAKEEGMTPMIEDGVEKIFRGVITLQEIFRIIA
jgi:type IV pilus assembly protein PilB